MTDDRVTTHVITLRKALFNECLNYVQQPALRNDGAALTICVRALGDAFVRCASVGRVSIESLIECIKDAHAKLAEETAKVRN